jgi:hypothetical protein
VGSLAPRVRIVVTCKKKETPGSIAAEYLGSNTAWGDKNPGAYRSQQWNMVKISSKQWFRNCYYQADQAS